MLKEIAIDFETYLISESMPVPKPVCLSYYMDREANLLVGKDAIHKFLDITLNMTDTVFIAHNAQFEGLVIYEWFPTFRKQLIKKYNENKIICTKVYEQLLDNRRKQQLHKFSLDKLVSHYFKEDISAEKTDPDAWRLRYEELDGIPKEEWPERAINYAIDDSIWAYKIYQEQKKTKLDINLSIKAEFWLNKMGLYGMEVNLDRVKQLEEEILEKITPKYKKLEANGLAEKTKTGKYKKNMKVFKEYIENLPIEIEKTAKGNVSTSTESLKKYYENTKDEILKDYLDIILYEKVLTAFISRLKQAKPHIRTQYNAVVSSGRTSSRTSAQFPSVNIQQMPREVPDVTWDIRNCFIPREGYKIVSIDYSGLELSSTAHQLYMETGRCDMRSFINKGDKPVDAHSNLAARIMSLKKNLNIDYDHFMSHKKEKEYAYYRQLSKPINLGFPGGIGYDTMRTILAKEGIVPKLKVLESHKYENILMWKRAILREEGYPVRVRRVAWDEYQLVYDELVELKQELFNLYPDLEYFLTTYHESMLNDDTKLVKNEFGEWEEEPLYNFKIPGFERDNCMYTQVCNGFLMQSPAAIGAKHAVCDIMEKYHDSEKVHPLAFIHDELVFEVKSCYNMEEVIKDLSEIMIDGMQKILWSVRITVEAEAFDYWKKAGGFYEATYWKDPNDKTLKGK